MLNFLFQQNMGNRWVAPAEEPRATVFVWEPTRLSSSTLFPNELSFTMDFLLGGDRVCDQVLVQMKLEEWQSLLIALEFGELWKIDRRGCKLELTETQIIVHAIGNFYLDRRLYANELWRALREHIERVNL